jgi:hypothetical protein
MGSVIPFSRKQPSANVRQEHDLLEHLRGNLQVLWRDGWVEAGESGGVVLLRRQHCLGIWRFDGQAYTYSSIATGEPILRAASIEDAYAHTLLLLGDLPLLSDGEFPQGDR